MRSIRGASMVGLLVLGLGAAPAEAKEPVPSSIVNTPVGQRLDHAIQTSTGGGFWGAILVADKDGIVLAKGYGNADYGSTPNTARTLF